MKFNATRSAERIDAAAPSIVRIVSPLRNPRAIGAEHVYTQGGVDQTKRDNRRWQHQGQRQTRAHSVVRYSLHAGR